MYKITKSLIFLYILHPLWHIFYWPYSPLDADNFSGAVCAEGTDHYCIVYR